MHQRFTIPRQIVDTIHSELRTRLMNGSGLVDIEIGGDHPAATRAHLKQARNELTAVEALLGNLFHLLALTNETPQNEEILVNLPHTVKCLASRYRFAGGDEPVEIVTVIAPSVPGKVRCNEARLHQILKWLLDFLAPTAREIRILVAVEEAPPVVVVDLHAVGDFVRQARCHATGEASVTEDCLEPFLAGAYATLSGGGLDWPLVSPPRIDAHLRYPVAELLDRPTTPPVERQQAPQILVVDDNSLNLKVVEHLLRKRGWTTFSVTSGEAAVEACRHKSFDLVLMDLNMPGKDGLETATAIRREERILGRRVPIVALTAHAMGNERERCQQAGMNDFLTKPVHQEALYTVCERLLGTAMP